LSDSQPPDLAGARVVAVERPSLATLLTLAVGVVVVAGLYLGREVLVPITLALLLSFLLAPLVDRLRRLRLPKTAAVLLATAFALGVILALGMVLGTQVADLADDLPRYESTIEGKVSAARGYITGHVEAVLGGLGRELQTGGGQPQPAPSAQVDTSERKPVLVEVAQPGPSPFKLIGLVVMPALGPLGTAGIIVIVTVFILMQQEDVRDRLIRLFGSNDLHRTTIALDDAGRRLSRYFLVQLGLNAGLGVAIGIGLLVIGVPNPMLWGIVTMLMRFVPYVGSWISAALPLTLAAAVDPGWSMAVWTVVLFVCAEGLMGQVIEPLVYGHSTGMSPLSVILAAIFWTWLWGPVGLVLSTPITLCLVVLGRHFEPLRFLDVLLGDRPPLTPVEGLYQRILAGDGAEALDQAETLLEECVLVDYYDVVVIPALSLAAADAQRGVMSVERLAGLRDAVSELVEDLADTEDGTPRPRRRNGDHPQDADFVPLRSPLPLAPPQADRAPAWRSDRPVLCVAGRGPLDGAAALMLAQLLGKHGIGADTVTAGHVMRTPVAGAQKGDYAMVCVACLQVPGTLSRLRPLLRQVRARYPASPILLGVWPRAEGRAEAEEEDRRLRAALGIELQAHSLREAVATCLDAAARPAAARSDAA
jgi:predicted PurR-regulated permease PerM